MSKTLTIVINNIPEDQLSDIWNYSQQEAKNDFGIDLVSTDNITVDFDFIGRNYPENIDILSSLTGGAITCHLIMEADKILNP